MAVADCDGHALLSHWQRAPTCLIPHARPGARVHPRAATCTTPLPSPGSCHGHTRVSSCDPRVRVGTGSGAL
eukprot:3009459-Rhodomonas_salina.1